MKKLFLCVILFVAITGTSLFAWSASDLMNFPKCVEATPWQLNFGVGFGYVSPDFGRHGHYSIPTFRLSFDRNAPLGPETLPFFFGGLVAFYGEGYRDNDFDYFRASLPVGFRAGYHFNWGVDRLDTYAVTTVGSIFYVYSGDYEHYWRGNDIGRFLFNIDIGVRWFVTDWFGFWAEAGYGSIFNVFNLGFAFKF